MITEDTPVNRAATTSVAAIAGELLRYDSPLLPYVRRIWDFGQEYRIDPSFFMGVVKQENVYGAHDPAGDVQELVYDPVTGIGTYNWARIPDGAWGGRRYGRRHDSQYPNPEAGIRAFFAFIANEYVPRGQTTPFAIWWGIGGSAFQDGEHAYSPASQNAPFTLDVVIATMRQIETAWTLFPVEVARA